MAWIPTKKMERPKTPDCLFLLVEKLESLRMQDFRELMAFVFGLETSKLIVDSREVSVELEITNEISQDYILEVWLTRSCEDKLPWDLGIRWLDPYGYSWPLWTYEEGASEACSIQKQSLIDL